MNMLYNLASMRYFSPENSEFLLDFIILREVLSLMSQDTAPSERNCSLHELKLAEWLGPNVSSFRAVTVLTSKFML